MDVWKGERLAQLILQLVARANRIAIGFGEMRFRASGSAVAQTLKQCGQIAGRWLLGEAL